MTRREKKLLLLLVVVAFGSAPAIADNVIAFRAGPGSQITCESSTPSHLATRGVYWCDSSNSNKPKYTYPDGTVLDLSAGGGGGISIGDAIASGASGDILYVDASGHLAQSGNLQWDATNHTLDLLISDNSGAVYNALLDNSNSTACQSAIGFKNHGTFKGWIGGGGTSCDGEIDGLNISLASGKSLGVFDTSTQIGTWNASKLEAAGKLELDGSSAAVSASGNGAIRFDSSGHHLQYSENTGAWTNFISGGSVTLDNAYTNSSGVMDITSSQPLIVQAGSAYAGDMFDVKQNGGLPQFTVDATAGMSLNYRSLSIGSSPSARFNMLNTVDATGSSLTETSPGIEGFGSVWNGSAVRYGDYDIYWSGTSGASYTSDFVVDLMRNFVTSTAALKVSYDGSAVTGSLGGVPIVTTTATQTLTNKTLTTATIGPRGLIAGSGTAPTCAPNANAGSTATCNSIAGTDTAFKFVITAGGTGGATGTWATITFNGTWGHTPMCVASWNKAGAASAYEFGVDYAGSSTTTMKVSLLYGTDFLPAATTFVVHCIDPGV